MIFHVSSAEGAARIRQARGEGLKGVCRDVSANTCSSPPTISTVPASKAPNGSAVRRVRQTSDQEALWGPRSGRRRSADGVVRPRALPVRRYRQVSSIGPDPGLQGDPERHAGPRSTAAACCFDAMVSQGRLGLEKFVSLTANRARKDLRACIPRKGEIVIGADCRHRGLGPQAQGHDRRRP